MERDESPTQEIGSMPVDAHERAADRAIPASSSEHREANRAGRNSIDHLAGQQIRYTPIALLNLPKRTLRTHPDKQIAKIAASIRQFGFNNAVLIDERNNVIAGAGRIRAAEQLGMTSVPTVCLAHMSDAEKRAYAIGDNKIPLSAGWDEKLLSLEIAELEEIITDFEIEIIGFDTVEIDRMGGTASDETDEADVVPPTSDRPAVTQLGDLFELGVHRLICADALIDESYVRLLAFEQAQMGFFDNPYNVATDGHATGNGAIKHRQFVMASGEMSQAQFREFLATAMARLAAHSVDGAIHYHCMDHRHIGDLLEAAMPIYGQHKNLCIWNKDNAGLGTFYRSKYEMIVVFKVGTAPHINNFGLGERGRYRTNVWDYPGVNTFKTGRDDELAMHPTVKPVALVADAIKDCSSRGGIILDCFGGSGTTLIAAEKTKRRARLMELDPIYCDTIIRRFERFTGLKARHVETGMTFDELAVRRLGEDPRS